MARTGRFAFPLLLALLVGPVYPTPPQSQSATANELALTPSEEKDSYEIYSILLKTEMAPEWRITAWAIRGQTQAFPAAGQDDGMCLEPAPRQKSSYQPVIDDYVAKNKKKLRLENKFDLPQFALIGPNGSFSALPFSTSVIYHVSAVGFNRDSTRALVYVGHECGGLCGGGTYHFMVKKDGRWQADLDYRGTSCAWAA